MIGFGREMKHFPSEAGHDEVALWKEPEARAFTYKWEGPASAGGKPFMPRTPLPEGVSKVRRRPAAVPPTALSPSRESETLFFSQTPEEPVFRRCQQSGVMSRLAQPMARVPAFALFIVPFLIFSPRDPPISQQTGGQVCSVSIVTFSPSRNLATATR